MKQIKVALVFGGRSAEHDISLRSAQAIYHYLDRKRFQPVLIYINREGRWNLSQQDDFQESSYYGATFHSFLPWELDSVIQETADIYFPVLHGPYGEDGRIQSIFEMADQPYVGANSFSSALAMDKVVSKMLFIQSGLKTPEFLFFLKNDFSQISEQVNHCLGYPVFVKPCSLGSSVGISKVKSAEKLKKAVDIAFSYDQKILIESGLDIREIEVSVMGNRDPIASAPGELIPHEEFYDYKDKYMLNQTEFRIPVSLGEKLERDVREIALKAFHSLFLNGMSRVDLFLEIETNEIYVNEINTIPGFTTISMFPKLWEAAGISFTELLTRLIDYGFEYHRHVKSRVDLDENIGH